MRNNKVIKENESYKIEYSDEDVRRVSLKVNTLLSKVEEMKNNYIKKLNNLCINEIIESKDEEKRKIELIGRYIENIERECEKYESLSNSESEKEEYEISNKLGDINLILDDIRRMKRIHEEIYDISLLIERMN